MQHDQFLRHPFAQISGGADLFEHLQRFAGRCLGHLGDVGHPFFFTTTQVIKGSAFGFDVGQIGAIQIGHSQLAEDVIKDRGCILDAVIPLNHACGFELGEGEGVYEFLQRHPVLQADRHCDGEVVHHGPEACTFFVHVDEYLAQLAVFIFARAQIDFVPADNRFLGVALAAFRHFFAVRFDDLFNDHFLDDFLG